MVARRSAACAVQVFAFYIFCSLADDLGSNVVKYDFDTYFDQVPTKNNFVMFFAPWCGHCKRLAPTWDELGAKYNTIKDRSVTIAKVDCTADSEVCSNEGVTGYPTLKFFPTGQDSVRYKGPRDLDSLEEFLKDQLGITEKKRASAQESTGTEKGLVELADTTFHEHTAQGMHFVKFYAPWCGHCQQLAPTWDQLAQTEQRSPPVSISKIDCVANRPICNEYGISGYPSLMWFQDGQFVEKYQGGRSLFELRNYIDEMRSKFSQEKEEEEEESVEEEEEDMRVPDKAPPPVIVLTADNFSSSVSRGLTFVKFFAPWCGHCKRLAPTWEDLARKLVGQKITVAEVDCTIDSCKELCHEQKVEGYPTMVLYRNGMKVKEYSGNRDLDSLFSFVMNHIQRDEL